MQEIVSEIHSWMIAAGEKIKENLNKESLIVETKSGRKDLVTELDKAWTHKHKFYAKKMV